ncbi:LysR family transcriptional regulator [Teichococcus oryzae]|uniref:LysR family transcriptional regulator n=1 Tax=Teichococcus oryzae TaxID=1608942 RepID=A0A5B2TCS3_9PROT|nr:LysR substrate-binding domain-containing protein [Pseudoroseomonas oryzae]KAA2211959.1 LysR family transcriptional regulator [Pseudoroseomonas oryzae]
MDFRQLRTFKAVAELGSLGKASDRLRIAQPALSRHIKLLEHELRAELFIRNGRGMQLTSAGRMLLERTAGLVRQMEQARDDIQSFGASPAGRVVLGLVPTVSALLSARFARRVVNELPDVALCIVESYGGHLLEWLSRGEMDLALIYGPAVDLHLSARPLGRDKVVVVGQPGSGLKQTGLVRLEWLVQQKLVLPSHPHGLRSLIERAAAKRGLSLRVMLEADSYRVLTSFVEEGLGFSVLPPSSIAAELRAGRLEAAPLSPPVTRELVLAAPVDRPSSVAAAAIGNLIVEEIRCLSGEGLWDIRLEM